MNRPIACPDCRVPDKSWRRINITIWECLVCRKKWWWHDGELKEVVAA